MERNHAIDYFKFWAIFFVVCIHTAPFSGTMVLGIDGNYINFFINSFARFGVPFFFVVSGFLFGQKISTSSNTKKYFKKYFMKIVKLFIYWYLFYIMYGLALNIVKGIVEGLSIRQEIINYLSSFIGLKESMLFIVYGDAGGPASYHLWYLSALIWSILAVYVFIKINKLNVLLFISLLLNVIGLFGQTYSGIFSLEFLNDNVSTRDAVFYGLFYTTLGCYIAFNYNWIKQKVDKIKSSMFVTLFFIFSFTQIGERAIANIFWAEEIRATDFYLSTIFLTICLFLFVIKNGHIGKKSILTKVGKNAVGIYVSHTLFIDLTVLTFEFLGIDIRESFVFHLIFTPLIFVTAYLFYNLLQIIKLKIKLMVRSREIGSEPRVKNIKS